MIRIDKVTTKAGDGGETSLSDGSRVSKEDVRIEVLGALDESNAVLGILRLHCGPGFDPALSQMQHTLFDIGGVLSGPGLAQTLASLPAKVEELTTDTQALAAAFPPVHRPAPIATLRERWCVEPNGVSWRCTGRRRWTPRSCATSTACPTFCSCSLER